jgi:serine/threonine-protein kinase HipA
MAEREVEVCVQIAGDDVLAGRLWSHRRRGVESQTFAYAAQYLARRDAFALDPALPLALGQHQTPEGLSMFAAFSDSAPERWGRRLIARHEQQRVRREGGTRRAFGEIDYLLGVRDDLRQGAVRFRMPRSSAYLAAEDAGVPHLLELGRLLDAADRLERDEAGEEELAILLRAGSSLGGARPKAHVRDTRGRIAIAKFPSPAADRWDVMRWESVALRLARDAGVRVPVSALHEIVGRSVLVVERFDRAGDRRIGYVSAMTLLEAADGAAGSYLEIADVIERESPHARRDLHELWRRIAFSILISNFDDHLRNHGFLRESSAGWALSPAFDLNPDPRPGPRLLHTAIDFDDNAARLDILMGVKDAFRLDDRSALAILATVAGATARWAAAARRAGLNPAEIEDMAPAFEHDQTRAARELAGT